MAYSFLRTFVQTRSRGHTATGTVCYRMGLAATSTFPGADDEPRRFDYTRRSGILATGYAAPPGTDASWGDPITWAHRIEAVDKRKNSRQCRDDVVAIPTELIEAGKAAEAIQAYADRLAEVHRTVVHYAVHQPARGGKNYHGHVLYPGRFVEGLGFSRKRDRKQDNPGKDGGQDLITRHKRIWSEICRGYGIDLSWESDVPGHHLGPNLCAAKRARLVEGVRESVRGAIAATTPGDAVVGERALREVAEIATHVNAGLTVGEMLEVELTQAQRRDQAERGQLAPCRVPALAAFEPEVLPPRREWPEVLPPMRTAEVLPPIGTTPEVLPPPMEPHVLPVARQPEVVPPRREAPRVLEPVTAPEVLPPRMETPGVLPPVHRPEVLPAGRRRESVFPPRQVVETMIVAQAEERFPRETVAVWSEVERQLKQWRQTLAHEIARAAASKMRDRARARARLKSDQAAEASSGRIQGIASALLNAAGQLLERGGLKADAAPEREGKEPAVGRAATTASTLLRPRKSGAKPSEWTRYEARWPENSAADEVVFRELTLKPSPEGLGRSGLGMASWRRALGTMFREGERDPKPLPRPMAPGGQASPGAAIDVADYVDSLPRRYRERMDEEHIVERSRGAEERIRNTLRYRFASEGKRQTLRDDAVQKACAAEAQRLDREMHAERSQWRRHWDVLGRHATMLREEGQEGDLRRLRESLQEHRQRRSRNEGPVRTGAERGR